MKKIEIIAEIGQNHNGDMGLAFELIQEAKASGADVAKFQLYDARQLFPKENNPWFDYNCQTELTRNQLESLHDECQRVGIEFMASVFDTKRIDWLEALEVKRYKVASRSVYEKVLISKLVETGKDLIVSLGLWKGEAFPSIEGIHVDYLFCISKYPTPLEDLKLDNIDFSHYSGFSDHTVGLSASLACMARGARILERHFTLDQKSYGPDHALSITPGELSFLNQFRLDLETMKSADRSSSLEEVHQDIFELAVVTD